MAKVKSNPSKNVKSAPKMGLAAQVEAMENQRFMDKYHEKKRKHTARKQRKRMNPNIILSATFQKFLKGKKKTIAQGSK